MTRRCTDELLELCRRSLNSGELSEWERGLVLSCLGRAKRQGPSWEPTPRQRACLERIASQRQMAPLIEDAPQSSRLL